MITLRRYGPDDLEAVIDIFYQAVRRVAARDYTPEQIATWAPDEIDRPGWAEVRAAKPTWIAELEGRAVGFSDLEPDGHIDMMFVHADFQRRGVARALLTEVERQAHAAGLRRLYTEASITARPFFERHGFRVVAEQQVAPDGVPMINYRMEKTLAPS